MKPNVSSCIAAVVAVFGLASLAAEDAITMRAKWPVGKRLVYRIDLSQESEFSAPGMPEPVKNQTEMGQEYALSILKEREGGGREVEMVFTAMKMVTKMNGNEMASFDSKESAERNGDIAPILAKLLGAKITLIVAKDGKVEKVENTEVLAGVASQAPQAYGDAFKSMVDPAQLKNMLNWAEFLPAKPVKKGDTWLVKATQPAPSGAELEHKTSVTFSATEVHDGHKSAVMKSAETFNTTPGGEGSSFGMKFAIKDGKGTGATWFDVEKGILVDSKTDQEMTAVLTGPNPQTSEPMEFSIPIKQRISNKLVEIGDVKK